MLCAKPAVVVGRSLEEVSTSVIGVSENLSGLSPIHPRLAATGSSLWAVLFPPVDSKDSFLLLVGMVCSSVCRSKWGQSDHRLRFTTSSSGAKETCRLLKGRPSRASVPIPSCAFWYSSTGSAKSSLTWADSFLGGFIPILWSLSTATVLMVCFISGYSSRMS